MTKENMMKEAHRRARSYEGDYSACLSLALKELQREGVKEMTIEKNGIKFEIKFNGTDVKMIPQNTAKGYATFYLGDLSEKTVFSHSTMRIGNGQTFLGFIFTQEQIEVIKKEYTREEQEIKDFLNRAEYEIEEYKYRLYIKGEEAKKLQKMNEGLFYELSEKFLKENKANLKEVRRTAEAFEDDIVYYAIEKEIEVVKNEYVRDLTEEESKRYNKGDSIDDMTVATQGRQVVDIDYGKMIKSFKVLLRTKKEIKKITRI